MAKRTQQAKEFEFRLISVSFKEAALDSPTFRTAMTHFDHQLQLSDEWFHAFMGLVAKIPASLDAFRSMFAITDHIVLPTLEELLVDPEYTLPVLLRSQDAVRRLWNTALSVFSVDVARVELAHLDFLRGVARYRALRSSFKAHQHKYDQYYATYMATAKLTEPEFLLEESRQLAQVRLDYLRVSLELVAESQQLKELTNRIILGFSDLFWSKKVMRLASQGPVSENLKDVARYMRRARSWLLSAQKAHQALAGDLAAAKASILAAAEARYAPSSNLADYTARAINQKRLMDDKEKAVEKHGYLCLKTWTERTKVAWVKRWAYLQNGVFSFLVPSPNHRSVQETDKIGVLLCNVKYAPNEDRQFCFELKTMDTTVVLQAESLADLKLWLKVFDNAKANIVDESDPMHALLDVASHRYPPLFADFACLAPTAADKALTTRPTRGRNDSGAGLSLARLLTLVERSSPLKFRDMYGLVYKVYLPLPTETSRQAFVAHAFMDHHVPSAINANIVGLSNWGVRALEIDPDDPDEEVYTKKIGPDSLYPSNYPDDWVARDIQLKTLFEGAVGRSECCLLSFACLVAPNSSQSLRGTYFVTHRYVYCYLLLLGFVLMRKVPISRFVEATCQSSELLDMLALTLVLGQVFLKVFLEDGQLLERKLNFLFSNVASDKPLEVEDIITQLQRLDDVKPEVIEVLPKEPKDTMASISPVESPNVSKLHQQVRFDDSDIPFLAKTVVPLPPQAVFHILCGSESQVLNNAYEAFMPQWSDRHTWVRQGTKLVRSNISAVRKMLNEIGRFRITQEIEHMSENEFYSVKVTKLKFKISNGPEAEFVERLTVQKLPGDRSLVQFYCALYISNVLPLNFIVRYLCRLFEVGFVRHVMSDIQDAVSLIGRRGKIHKAIYFYGKVQVTDKPYEVEAVGPMVVTRRVMILIFARVMYANVIRASTAIVYCVVNLLKTVGSFISVHMLLLFLIGLLVLSNIYFASRGTQEYWSAKQARNLVEEVVTMPMTFERAIYLKDIQDFASRLAFSKSSQCFQLFRNESFIFNHHEGQPFSSALSHTLEGAALDVANDLYAMYRDLGVRRNELMVNLAMLNTVEENLVRSEWRNWLVHEAGRCSQLATFANSTLGLSEYCDSCACELAQLLPIL